MVKLSKLIFIKILASMNLLMLSNYTHSQIYDASKDSPEVMLENCYYLECEKIYTQYQIQRALGTYLNWALHPVYYQQPANSKFYLKGASILLKKLNSCVDKECPDSFVSWSENNLSEAQSYLSCLHLIPTTQYDEILRNLWVHYSTGKGVANWPLAYEFNLNGAYAFVDKNDFPTCANVQISEKALSNLRLVQPKWGYGVF